MNTGFNRRQRAVIANLAAVVGTVLASCVVLQVTIFSRIIVWP